MKLNKTIAILSTFGLMGLASCSDNSADTETIDTSAELYTEVLTDLSVDVITQTYFDLSTNASAMNDLSATITIGDETTFSALKEAWQDTRAPWEKTEGFLYGPVDTEGIDPAIDSWPVDVNAINNILNSGNPITSSLLESNNEARGFHTIEYFIWGLDGDKTAAELTDREIEYLQAVTQNLKEKTAQLYDGWTSSGDNFAANFILAGESGSIYTSQKDALQEIVEGLAIIADEVANGKIEEPLNGNNGSAKPEAEESRFSNNSKLDFANNIRSIQNIYLGDYDGNSGKGITDVIVTVDAGLDAEVKAAITAGITSIEAIPGTFTDAIVDNRSEVENAQEKVLELLTLLESRILPAISNL
ncbi:imelysin family protein [Flagellimonas zhangzhouensis]|uniref:Uncharacterized iron-regulated protein n=1 Tax=Flagellimonas zhangzhouensis TaxID=1073328 RepID=A0A1H2YCY8_9FLAO|nr:imelysin family protein [Allomuricauda zhangzhouensis]SDQ96953.1 Uncharacterized iron-regulated protein [Allomuricauda zhangzhouensis]SDX03027.1 Uncharacterized iron-regulated protein [Allomuricauda zhangzhouensis]